MSNKSELTEIEVGVVGLGLMGTSIVVSLLMAGHPVKAIAPIADDFENASGRIREQLIHCHQTDLLKLPIEHYESKLIITTDYSKLHACKIVFECVIEKLDIKSSVYSKIAAIVQPDTVIASNTSAIAISVLQKMVPLPQRFMGVHWAEPAYATRFMEITCGTETDFAYAEWIFDIAHAWGKEPTLLRKDIRGFITNRLMYAVYRELFHLVESGQASYDDVDKVFRYDAGSWITLMGIFRRMDFLGLQDCTQILQTYLPQLSNSDKVPRVMQEIVATNARGTKNLKGLYTYTKKEAHDWENAFTLFNKDIFQLAAVYPYKTQNQ
jgi:3-hydroxybutyryl-CoA dehydrogenase